MLCCRLGENLRRQSCRVCVIAYRLLEAFGSLLLALARAETLLRARIDEEQEASALSE
jgi:hypothetical protein